MLLGLGDKATQQIGMFANLAIGAFAAAKQAKELRKQQRYLNAQQRFNDLWYSGEYNKDYFQTDEARSALKIAQDAIKQNLGRIQGNAAITGATDEAVVANNAAGMNAIGDFSTKLAGRADERKDRVQAIYFNRKGQLENKQDAVNAQKAQNWANLMQNAGNISEAANIASMIPTVPDMSEVTAPLEEVVKFDPKKDHLYD